MRSKNTFHYALSIAAYLDFFHGYTKAWFHGYSTLLSLILFQRSISYILLQMNSHETQSYYKENIRLFFRRNQMFVRDLGPKLAKNELSVNF